MPAKCSTFSAIGHVENGIERMSPNDDLQAVESRIVLDPALVEGLTGLAPGQEILVIFCFDRSEGFDLLQHARGDASRPRRGVFALRTPRRPNPIGVSQVPLVAIEGNVLRVRNLDALDGSPVLDIKPAG